MAVGFPGGFRGPRSATEAAAAAASLAECPRVERGEKIAGSIELTSYPLHTRSITHVSDDGDFSMSGYRMELEISFNEFDRLLQNRERRSHSVVENPPKSFKQVFKAIFHTLVTYQPDDPR